jgi:RNA polymerase sigma factor (sigma-70 family)
MPPTRPGSKAVFPQTSWTLLAEACGADGAAARAREEFLTRYYKPVRAYLGSIVRDPERADELTQSFFERVVLSGRILRAADRSKGGFRPFLKQALRNFVTDDLRRQAAGPGPTVRPDAATRGWDSVTDGPSPPSPETEYHQAWVRNLLEIALTKVRDACAAKGQEHHFELFRGRYLSETEDQPSWRELGAPFGLDEKAARNRTETVARHFRLVLREMLAEDAGPGHGADEELAALLHLLS